MSDNYILRSRIEFENSADTEEWSPSESVLRYVPNIKELQVELITQDVDLNFVNSKLRESRIVGIVVMGPIIHRLDKPSLILLTTKEMIFAIDPRDVSRGIEFLRRKLQDDKIEFWTSNGLNESDSLLHNYGIDLEEAKRSNCCSGYHVHMMQVLHYNPMASLELYPMRAMAKARDKWPRIESFEGLVEIWLDVSREEIYIDDRKLAHLDTRPLSLTAINLIKKRSALVIPLAEWLKYYSLRECRAMSANVLSQFKVCNEAVSESLVELTKGEGRKSDPAIFAHLDNTFA